MSTAGVVTLVLGSSVLAAIVAGVVSIFVTLKTNEGIASRELAADVRRYKVEREERLRVAYTAAVRMAGAFENAARAEQVFGFDEPREERRDRIGSPVDDAQVAYNEKSAELLLDDEGVKVDELIGKMRQDYVFIAILTSRYHNNPSTIPWDKVIQSQENVTTNRGEMLEVCRKSLRALDVSRSSVRE